MFANAHNLPFLTSVGAHGAIKTMSKMTAGVGINLRQLSSVQVAQDGKTARIGGGTLSKTVVDELWAAGKQTVVGTCDCVGYVGAALGGGHGWLQGHYGLMADQFEAATLVLANGTLTTIDDRSELWWAMKGAGHNFGIVTSLVSRVYEIRSKDWAIETLIFRGDQVEQVYQTANEHLIRGGTQRADVINWSYWVNVPEADPSGPVILFWIIQEGVTAVDSALTRPFHDLQPLDIIPDHGDLRSLAGWTGISADAPPCQKAGLSNPRFPLYLPEFNATAQREAFDVFAAGTHGAASAFNNSIFIFESYPQGGVRSVPSDSTAFAFRSDNVLIAPLISYQPAGEARDRQARLLGQQLRDIVHQGSGRDQMRTYVNYAFGDESPRGWYGDEAWRQNKLAGLKRRYDPDNRFGFFAPVNP